MSRLVIDLLSKIWNSYKCWRTVVKRKSVAWISLNLSRGYTRSCCFQFYRLYEKTFETLSEFWYVTPIYLIRGSKLTATQFRFTSKIFFEFLVRKKNTFIVPAQTNFYCTYHILKKFKHFAELCVVKYLINLYSLLYIY